MKLMAEMKGKKGLKKGSRKRGGSQVSNTVRKQRRGVWFRLGKGQTKKNCPLIGKKLNKERKKDVGQARGEGTTSTREGSSRQKGWLSRK